jgi:hypothetical protein
VIVTSRPGSTLRAPPPKKAEAHTGDFQILL